ncbi:type II toxin-antitoxin system death-on-curing family toxin [Streptomyces sp. NPDC090075]|uniref:type II toxin-antitoxin system death-on-curing family toxin n=1 Tax=Streptomyces sp. NPDC090075 TaxID=3365937 RepID=UPI00380CAD24
MAVTLAERLYQEYDAPIPDFDARPPGKLEAALAQPFQTFGGEDLYPGLINKAAIFFYVMVKDHPLENGNKRVAVASLLLFLYKNGYGLRLSNGDLLNLAVMVAESDSRAMHIVLKALTGFISNRIQPSEMVLPWPDTEGL